MQINSILLDPCPGNCFYLTWERSVCFSIKNWIAEKKSCKNTISSIEDTFLYLSKQLELLTSSHFFHHKMIPHKYIFSQQSYSIVKIAIVFKAHLASLRPGKKGNAFGLLFNLVKEMADLMWWGREFLTHFLVSVVKVLIASFYILRSLANTCQESMELYQILSRAHAAVQIRIGNQFQLKLTQGKLKQREVWQWYILLFVILPW